MNSNLAQSPQFGAAFISQFQALKPAQPYTVTKLPGQVATKVYTYVQHGVKEIKLKDGSIQQKARFRLEETDVKVPAGYLIQFPNGHSIRVGTDEELTRLGFHLEPGLVSLETGDVIIPNFAKMQAQVEVMSLLPGGYIPPNQVEALVGSKVSLEDSGLKTRSAPAKKGTTSKKKGTS